MSFSAETYALCRKYTDEVVIGGGAIKGKNCTISDITTITGGHRVTFEWTLDDGTEQTDTLDVMDGVGVVAGGTKGQVLCKKSNSNYDTEWKTIGGPGGSADLTEDLTAAVAVGGVQIGDSWEAGTSLETVIRDVLEPTLYPTLTAPSATMTATGAKLLETGDTLSTTMSVAFNRGSINPAYGTDGYRSGAAQDYALNGGTAQASNEFSVTVDETQKTYQASVSYASGEQPKDSKGGDYDSPLAAGSVSTNTITYEFVNAMLANTSDITTIAKLSLISKSAKQRDMEFPAQTVANPEVFDVPASWTVTAVQVKNDLSGQYEDALAQFTVTDTTHDDAGGTSVAYKRYTFNLGYGTGGRTVRVKWN